MRDQDERALKFQGWLEEQGSLPASKYEEIGARVARAPHFPARHWTELPWRLVAGEGRDERIAVWLMLRDQIGGRE
jgi:hypothetical protein